MYLYIYTQCERREESKIEECVYNNIYICVYIVEEKRRERERQKSKTVGDCVEAINMVSFSCPTWHICFHILIFIHT